MTEALGQGKVGDPCTEGSPPVVCSPPAIKLADGSTLCTRGVAYCRDGVYTDCQYIQEYGLGELEQSWEPEPVPGVDRVGSIQSALITQPTSCDACHPDCFKTTDRPIASDLTPSNSQDVTYDPVSGGIRLKIVVDASERGPITGGAKCGDKEIEDPEQCDDGNVKAGDGCDATCLLEAGWFCEEEGKACARSQCGNKKREGLEQCDDGNLLIGDGCTFQCKREPVCALGFCTPLCGDGAKYPLEPCDDGNTSAGDGCSPACTIEPGWDCMTVLSAPPATIDLPIVYRDFKKTTGNDFEDWNGGFTAGIVEGFWNLVDKKPVPAVPKKAAIKSVASFLQWYNDVPGANLTYADTLTVKRQTDGTYAFDSTAFFPLDGKGWTAAGQETIYSGHNFSFTSEVRFWFQYTRGQNLTFRGDDDVWVFINGKLAVDIGGVHGPRDGSITLNAGNELSYGLLPGNLYEAAVFQAERHTSGSNYRLTLGGFFFGRTSCESKCGDGIVTPDEYCDDGGNNGKAGFCLADCQGRSPLYAPTASYWRDYTAAGTCKIPPQRPLWGNLTYSKSATPLLGGQIAFKLQGAETLAALPSAASTQVTVPYNNTTGSINIQTLLNAAGLRDDSPYLRVTAILTSSLDLKSTPLLQQFDVAYTCVNVE